MAHLLPAQHFDEATQSSQSDSSSRNMHSWQLNIFGVGKAVRRKRVRVNAVYALLVASILFTFISAVVICLEIGAIEGNLWNRASVKFNAVTVCTFIVLATTCSLALITIIKKDKNNHRLLSKLKSINNNLEEEVSKRTRELAEALKAKDHFLGVATHDLKSPLSGILGLVELVRLQNNLRSEEEKEYLAHIEYSCKKMQRLIDDILEINRIDQGNFKLKTMPVDLSLLLNKLRFDFLPQAERKKIELVFIQDSNVTICTDPDSLSRIVENLLSNAIKFSPSMKKVSLRVSTEHSYVKLAVSDEGPGIAPEEQPRLFSKFQKLSNRPTGLEISTGLGLSIVKELTNQLGGEISLKTQVGQGSTFIITIPRTTESRPL